MKCLKCSAQLAPVKEFAPGAFSAGKENPELKRQGNETYILCKCGAKNAIISSPTDGLQGLRVSHLLK